MFIIVQRILLVKLLKTIIFEQNCNTDGYEWITQWYECIQTSIIITSAANEANFYPIGVFWVICVHIEKRFSLHTHIIL